MFCMSLWYDDVRVLNPQPPTLKVIGCSPHIQQPAAAKLHRKAIHSSYMLQNLAAASGYDCLYQLSAYYRLPGRPNQ